MSLGSDLYKSIVEGVQYEPKTHCALIIDLFEEGKGIAHFCVETGISRAMFMNWQQVYPKFKQAVQVGKEVGFVKLMEKSEDSEGNIKDYSARIIKLIFGSEDKIVLDIDPKSSPLEHYQQVMQQAARGDFTSAEIKQIMESINIGLRAQEICELQSEINELKEGLKAMEERQLDYQNSTQRFTEENKAALDS